MVSGHFRKGPPNSAPDGTLICHDIAVDLPSPDWTRRLLAAYQAAHRDLPWRHTRDPYAIYISEIMLQQTQVQTVIPYYERFLARFPDPEALAAADPDELHKSWEGLGYYARARQMQKSAAQMVSCHAGRLPDDPALLRQLPGIGAYTVGAIRSIAFGHAEPAVDGNVVRVISRLYALPLVQGSVPDRERVTVLLQPQIPTDQPGDFNQALMELGALVCTPDRPRCPDCPIRSDCQAFAQGCAGSLPIKQTRKPVPEEPLTVVALQLGDRYHVQRRSGSLLKGLYQFDLLPGRMDKQSVANWAAGVLPPTWPFTLEPLPDRTHRFTHRLWRLSGFVCHVTIPEGTDADVVLRALRALEVRNDSGQAPADASGQAPADASGQVSADASGQALVAASALAALPFPTALAAYRSDVLSSGSGSELV